MRFTSTLLLGSASTAVALASSYDYVGCVKIDDIACLSSVEVAPTSGLTATTCKVACDGYKYAAVFWE